MNNKVFGWTPEQQQAISERGKNLLVSASAGSGKTTVMIQRIIDLMLGENAEKTPITNFLIVTFTKASASDMKKKLIDKLLELPVDDFILEQIENVEIADISDLHSFYSKLISTYFYELNIDPSYRIVDAEEGASLKDKAISKLFEEKEKSYDLSYFRLFDIFQKKRNNELLKEIIFKFDEFLNSIYEGDYWFQSKINECYVCDLEKNIYANLINSYVTSSIERDVKDCENFAEKCSNLGSITHKEYFEDVAMALKSINKHNTYLVNAKNVFELVFPRAKRTPKEFEFLKDEAEILKAKIKKNVINYKNNYVSDDENVLKNGVQFVKENLEALYKFTVEFNEIYSKLKKEINGLDFNDLEKYALKILQNSAICDAVKSKYKYVFVDEFQDVNEVQEKIISMISRENNRFMVGDIKQSIYRFRHCDPEIFMNKAKLYSNDEEHSKLIKLNCNFRSDKKILKFVDEVFSGVMTQDFGGVDYEKDSQFVAGESNLDNPFSVNLCYIDSSQEKLEKKDACGVYSIQNHTNDIEEDVKRCVAEANYVAGKIAELTNPLQDNPMKFGDIAILVQSRNEDTLQFLEVLQSYGIPISSDEKYDLMSRNYIQEIINFINYICASKDDILLFKVLKSKLFNFSDRELVEIRKFNMKIAFYECIDLYENSNNIALKQKLQNFIEKYNFYKQIVGRRTIQEMARLIVSDFELINVNLLDVNGLKINDEIDRFISRLPNKSAYEFLIEYPNFSMIFENECVGDSVNVMTIHKSKGIEFKAVFLINNAKQFNLRTISEPIVFNKTLGAGMEYYDIETRTKQPSIPMSAIRLFETRKMVEEEQRLLYVALTRAKEKLYVICSKQKNMLQNVFPKRPTAFINWFERFIVDEINGVNNEILNYEEFNINELLNVPKFDKKQLIFSDEEVKKLEDFEYTCKSSVSVPLKNSISKIINQNKCQTEQIDSYEDFKFDDEVISSAERGTIYHKFFQFVDLKNLANLDNEIQNAKNKLLESEKNVIDEKIVKNVLNCEFFKQIHQDDIILKEREFYAEVPLNLFNGETGDDLFILQGVVDLLIIKQNNAILLDYKTGNISDDKLKNYKFQIDVYSDVCERAYGVCVTKKILCFIDLEKIIEI